MRCASSQMTRSQSGAASSFAFSSSERAAMSSRTISRCFSTNGLPVSEASIWSRVRMSKREAELLGQLVLPLLDQAAGRDDQAALEVAADQQLLDQQPGHDRLAGAGIVGEQEAQRLARQHLAVDRRDLVRQRLDLRGADGQIGVEQVREADAVGLGREPQQRRRRRRTRSCGQPPRERNPPPRRGRRAARRCGHWRETRGSWHRRQSWRPNDLRHRGSIEAANASARLDLVEILHRDQLSGIALER